jgi:hypothetical protein
MTTTSTPPIEVGDPFPELVDQPPDDIRVCHLLDERGRALCGRPSNRGMALGDHPKDPCQICGRPRCPDCIEALR